MESKITPFGLDEDYMVEICCQWSYNHNKTVVQPN
jgi:hypothetical protein